MSHTNTTTNYGLPQFLSSDKPAWMADINVAFADIDSQMKTNADAASAAQSTADDSVLNGAPGYSNLSTYSVGDVVNYLGRVYKCDIAVTTPEAFDNAKWSYYRLSDASAQLDVIDGEIGSTDISSIGDGTITNAISTVNSNLSDVSDKYKRIKVINVGQSETVTLDAWSVYMIVIMKQNPNLTGNTQGYNQTLYFASTMDGVATLSTLHDNSGITTSVSGRDVSMACPSDGYNRLLWVTKLS